MPDYAVVSERQHEIPGAACTTRAQNSTTLTAARSHLAASSTRKKKKKIDAPRFFLKTQTGRGGLLKPS